MKTVTIYTDGIKTALRFYAEMSVLLALIRATAEHDKQAPSDKAGKSMARQRGTISK